MVFQNVTHLSPTSIKLFIGALVLLPSIVTTGEGLGLGVLRTLTSAPIVVNVTKIGLSQLQQQHQQQHFIAAIAAAIFIRCCVLV